METGDPRIQLNFYVYEHWRPDLDICFWVGKGRKRRAYKFERNRAYNAIIRKLHKRGMCAEVRMVASGLSEDEAFRIERERIAFWRSAGIALANKTDGGDGFSGFVRPKGIPVSEAARAKISQARRGIKFSEEHRAKLAERKVGVKRKPFTEETIAKMREAASRRETMKRLVYGDNVTRWSRLKGAS